MPSFALLNQNTTIQYLKPMLNFIVMLQNIDIMSYYTMSYCIVSKLKI